MIGAAAVIIHCGWCLPPREGCPKTMGRVGHAQWTIAGCEHHLDPPGR
jgi:hypothetical protein